MNKIVQKHVAEGTVIIVSPRARTQLLKSLLEEKENQYKGVQLSVKKTGCSGLSYVLDFVTEISPADEVVSLDEQYNLYIEKASYPYLKGIMMDYVTQGLGSKFVYTNPNQTGQCGCGESFTVAS